MPANTHTTTRHWFWDMIWRRPGRRWGLVVVLSLLLHLGLFTALRVYATQSQQKRRFGKVKIRLLKRRPPPPPKRKAPPKKKKKKPKKKKKKPKKKKKKKKKKKRKKRRRRPPPRRQPRRQPPPQRPPPQVFGVNKKSLSKRKGPGMAVKVGNDLMKAPDNKKLPKNAPRYRPAPPQPGPPPRRRGRSFAPVPIYEVDENPRELSKVQASYPPDAKERGIQAVVVLSVQIRRSGRVRRAKVVSIRPPSAASYGFGKAAVRALLKYRFRAARFKGKPVDVVVRYVYRFELED